MKCPNCGSSSQPKLVDTEYKEDGWDIEVIRHYKCGCTTEFIGVTIYKSDGIEFCFKVNGKDHKMD